MADPELIPMDLDPQDERTPAETPSNPYLDRLNSEIENSWSRLDELKNQLVINPTTKQEKESNRKLQNQIKDQEKNLKKIESTYNKEQASWEKRNPAPADAEGPGPDSAENYQLEDVTPERMQDVYGVTGFQDEDVQRIEALAEEASQKATSDIQALRDLGQQFMSGNIPADVSEAVQRASSAGAASRGIIGSQMSRNLTARDLGMTSMQLKEAGAQLVSNAAQMSQSQAAFQVARSQYRTQFQLASAELQDAIRRTDLSGDQLKEEKRQFKNKMILALNEQIINLAMFREELQYKYAATKLEGDAGKAAGPLSTIDNLFPQIRASLSFD